MYLSHINVFLPVSPSLPISVKINKIFKNIYTVWSHLHEVQRGVRFLETGSRRWEPGDGGGGMGSECLMGTVSVWEDEKVLEVDGGDGHTTV